MSHANNPANRAVEVTEAAMVAALEVMKQGETITPAHQQAIALGLLRAAARWWVMTTPHIADESARNGFALCLKQERINQHGPEETVQ